MLTVGSLCTGTGQLERALTLAGVDTKLAFVADPDPAATTLLAHHHPDVPNLGDITKVDWTRIASVDVFCAGYPCQGFSYAGLRLGENDARFIWPYVFAGVRDLRPRVVLLENVPGHLSLGFGRVLGDLASIGYDANWTCVRASDVGAAHKRDRVFILAFPAGTDPRDVLRVPAAGAAHGRRGDGAVLSLLPTPRASDTGTPGRRASEVVLPLFPTPRTSDTNGAGTHGDGGLDLRTAVTLLPDDQADRWGKHAPAVARWETVIGRPAPAATEPGKDDKPRLSPRFVEWLMGHVDGYVTALPLRHTKMLRLLGNGVVALQGAEAVRQLLEVPA